MKYVLRRKADMSRSSCSVPLQRRRIILGLCALFSPENLACVVSKVSERTTLSWPAVFFYISLKLSLQSFCIAVSSPRAKATRCKCAREFNFHVYYFSDHCNYFFRCYLKEYGRNSFFRNYQFSMSDVLSYYDRERYFICIGIDSNHSLQYIAKQCVNSDQILLTVNVTNKCLKSWYNYNCL